METVQEKAISVLRFFETKSVIEMQRRYRNQYGKAPSSDNATRRWLKQFQETGSVVAIESFILQMLEYTWREIEYLLDMLCAKKGAHVKVFSICSISFISCKLYSYTFIFRKQFYFIVSGLNNLGHGNTDNNLESLSIFFPRYQQNYVPCKENILEA
jgi:hypothetical protein